MFYINPATENIALLFFLNHLYCGQACQTGVQLERWQSLAAKLDTFHIFYVFFFKFFWDFFIKYFGFLSEIKFFGFFYQGCEVGVDIEETELRLDRLELTLPLWLCVAWSVDQF